MVNYFAAGFQRIFASVLVLSVADWATASTPLAAFIANPNSGQLPLTVQFTDKSIGAITNWDWNFGDGSMHSSSQNPSHTYSNAGLFSVTLTVTETNNVTNSKTGMVAVAAPPECSAQVPPLSAGMVMGWGGNYYGQINTCLSNVVAIAAGLDHSLFLKSDGTVTALGAYFVGFVPDGVFYFYAPVTSIPQNITNAIAISAGDSHSLALKANGTVIAWGINTDGQLDVPPGLTNVVAIAAGAKHSLALKSDGTVVGWGGVGASVPSGLRNIVAISAGRGNGLALNADGKIVGWNLNSMWGCRDPGTVSNIVAISAGDNCCYECWEALQANGSVTMGYNSVLSNVVAISASRGTDHHISLALLANGTVSRLPWGFNFYGGPPSYIPDVPPGLSNVIAIASGDGHNLALIGDSPPVMQVPASKPTHDHNGFHVTVASQCGRVYRLEYNDSLEYFNWTGLPLVAGNGGDLTLTDPRPMTIQRLYRVRRY